MSRTILRSTLTLGTIIGFAASCFAVDYHSAHAEDIRYPADAGVIDVTKAPYYAVPNDGQDDTAAIQNALKDYVGNSPGRGEAIIYLPNGVYDVSNTLNWNTQGGYNSNAWNGGWTSFVTLQGQSRAGTIIRLKNNCTGFTDVNSPKAVIYTASQDHGGAGVYSDINGEGNLAFRNEIRNLTIDCGSGNVGAIGADYQVSNTGSMRDVTIKSSGPAHIGLNLGRRDNGPGLVKNVSISGFARGIVSRGTPDTITFENINISGYTAFGVDINDSALMFRNLNTSTSSSVPALNVDGATGSAVLVDGNLSGGGGSAVVCAGGSSRILLRNIVASGYARVVTNRGSDVAGTRLLEWVSDAPLTLNSSQTTTLNLPVRETPEVWDSDLSKWYNVRANGAVPNDGDDDTSAIQAALNAAAQNGKTTVYFPRGGYLVSNTIIVPGSIRCITGTRASFGVASGHQFGNSSAPRPVFRFAGGNSNQITRMNQLLTFGDLPGGMVTVEHADARTLVLTHLTMGGGAGFFRNQSGAGPLFVEDACVGTFYLDNPQEVWMRQFNPEHLDPAIRQTGGKVWILGLKSEGGGTLLHTRSGGYTELLGAQIYPSSWVDPNKPQFINDESSVCYSFVNSAFDYNNSYGVLVREKRNGVQKDLTRNSSYWRGLGNAVPLYCGHSGMPTPQNLVSNPSFDAENYDTQTPSGWGEWSDRFGGNAGYTEAYGGSRSGARHGTHWASNSYNIYTYQTKTGLVNGLYTLRAWAKSSGGQTACILEAKEFGGQSRTVPLPVSNDYRLVEIRDINVSNGQCTIGFWSDAAANQWCYFDDVEFVKQESTALFATGFEEGDLQPTWYDEYDGRQSVSGYLQGVNPECSPRFGEVTSAALMYSGRADASYSYCYYRVFNVNIPVSQYTTLSYKIMPQNDNGRYVAVDMLCSDGTTLRDSGVVDSNGFSLHPGAGHGGNIPLNAWTTIKANIGSRLAGKTITRIWVPFDRYNGPGGQYRGYIDDIKISN